MSAQGTIKRYTLLIEKIVSARYPSFHELQNFLAVHDLEISQRTLQRDIEQIRNEFNVEIKYNRLQNGYFVDRDSGMKVESFLRLLQLVRTANLFSESLADGKNSMTHILFDSENNLKGIEHLEPLLFSIKNQRRVSFVHENFETEKKKKYLFSPYILKEYQYRWYVVGTVEGMNDLLIFGIDRIENVKVLTTLFVRNEKLKPVELFENIVGLNFSKGEPEEIILSFTPLQGKYVKALPFHKSQKVLEENKKETIVKLFVVPNFELTQKILMIGHRVKVVKPEWLVKEIKIALKRNLKNYK